MCPETDGRPMDQRDGMGVVTVPERIPPWPVSAGYGFSFAFGRAAVPVRIQLGRRTGGEARKAC
jgi:hypothetical protein